VDAKSTQDALAREWCDVLAGDDLGNRARVGVGRHGDRAY
jgi:hypothetical protein